MNKILNGFKGMNRKLMIYIVTLFVVIIVGITILSILKATIFGRIPVTKLEGKMLNAAKEYFNETSNRLPINDKDTEAVTISELVNGKYLKSLDKLLKDQSLTCSGSVTVTNNGGYYLYSTNLNCGDKYKTQKLYEVVTDVKNIVTEKDGLYQVGDDYVFRGENVNNYVSFDEQLWRILRVNGSDNTIRMIQVNKTEDKYVWDDRYNSDKDDYIGINKFDVSRIKDTIENYWKGEKIIYDKNKGYISTQPLCIGKRDIDDIDKTNKKDCSNTYGNYSITLPLPSDYIIVSLDSKCKYVDNSACTNYNFLVTLVGSTWTSIVDERTTHKAYKMAPSPMLSNTNSEAPLRFVVNLSNEVNFNSGDGSIDNPYTVK